MGHFDLISISRRENVGERRGAEAGQRQKMQSSKFVCLSRLEIWSWYVAGKDSGYAWNNGTTTEPTKRGSSYD